MNNLPTLNEQVAKWMTRKDTDGPDWFRQELLVAEQRGMHRVAADMPRKEETPNYFDTTV